MAQFEEVFLKVKNEPQATFFDQLYKGTEWVLNVQNPVFRNAKKEMAVTSGKAGDSLLLRISDSIYRRLPAEIFWKDQQVDRIRFQKLLDMSNEKLCPCIKERIGRIKNKRIWEIVSECDSASTKDPAFADRLKVETKHFAASDLYKAQRYVVKYLYANCPVFRKSLHSILGSVMLDDYHSFGDFLAKDLETDILRFFKTGTDSLSILFPNYAVYTNDIQSSMELVKKAEWFANREREPGTDNYARIRTYYTKGKNPVILGQTICLYEQKDISIMVKSFRFIPPEKIKNKEELV